jgi:hypothetical protein
MPAVAGGLERQVIGPAFLMAAFYGFFAVFIDNGMGKINVYGGQAAGTVDRTGL